MTMLAGSETTFEQRMVQAADRMHVVPRGVTPGVNSVGEDLGPGEAGSPRIEVRMSLNLSGDDLLAALWDSAYYWEIPGHLSVELVRWHAMSSLMTLGGPESDAVDRLVRDARAVSRRGDAEARAMYARAVADIERAFGITV
ncbi:hypothetical protein [Streptomyces sp. UH6]|uniref:hypothetical protein n=1 Tax=Streptomyces sp. UH6 TaxID=2748379 RepID=UPI0015D4821C|nr:hypothetical protein [Streptomyces sp. UH6]NYV76275.1 hypothetical protein [Streptomyces sp. UH6]